MIGYSYWRVSTPRQMWGDGKRRQAADSAKYCDRVGLELDTTLRLWDRGVSAYHGKNLSDGALGRFLEAVKTKKIKTPCALVCEGLDRLTRDTVDEGFFLMMDLIRAGVEVHTLKPEAVYSRETIKKNPAAVMIAVADLMRGNSESEMKSHRSLANWQRKRETAQKKVMTARVPHWLEVIEGAICVKPGCGELIRQMAKRAIDGWSVKRIVRQLNGEGVPVFTNQYMKHIDDGSDEGSKIEYKKPLWDACYVLNVLRSRALIGEYQPQQRTAAGRVKCSAPIQDYYPAVLSVEVFNRLQIALTARRGKIGRNGDKVSNLFKGLLRDAHDGGTMHSNCKGSTAFLVNRNGSYGKGAFRSIRYDCFEQGFLRWIQEVQLTQEEGSNTSVIEAAIADLDQRIMAATEAAAKHPKFTSLVDTLVKLEEQRYELNQQLEAERQKTPVEASLTEARKLCDTTDIPTRLALRQRIAELVSVVWLLISDNGKQKSAKVTFCHCQVFFKNGDRREFWLRQSRAGGQLSIADPATTPTYDLRKYTPRSYNRHLPQLNWHGQPFVPRFAIGGP